MHSFKACATVATPASRIASQPFARAPEACQPCKTSFLSAAARVGGRLPPPSLSAVSLDPQVLSDTSRRACPLHVPLSPQAAAAPSFAAPSLTWPAGPVAVAAASAGCVTIGGIPDGRPVDIRRGEGRRGQGLSGGGGSVKLGDWEGVAEEESLDELGEEFWASADYCGFLRYSYEPGTMRRCARAPRGRAMRR